MEDRFLGTARGPRAPILPWRDEDETEWFRVPASGFAGFIVGSARVSPRGTWVVWEVGGESGTSLQYIASGAAPSFPAAKVRAENAARKHGIVFNVSKPRPGREG